MVIYLLVLIDIHNKFDLVFVDLLAFVMVCIQVHFHV
jgi:hypothetical protein